MENNENPKNDKKQSLTWQDVKAEIKKTAKLVAVLVIGVIGTSALGSLIAIHINGTLGIVVTVVGFVAVIYTIRKLKL
ncbi:MAG: hypothetical protein HYW78_00495 [Parcubacteria group bacterium]|nr:hypothetical protein [Parcubacteria group bacterium]